MESRHVYLKDASIFDPNGVKVAPTDLPSTTNIKYFVSGILSILFNKVNCPRSHKCGSACNNTIAVTLGFPFNPTLISACPNEVHVLIRDFEHLLAVFILDTDGFAEIRSVRVEFKPCAKCLVITNVSIYT